MKAYISTNGCEIARLKSMDVQQFLTCNDSNVKITTNVEEADLIIFYACGLTNKSEEDGLRILKGIRSRMKPTARIVVWGCLSKVNPKSLAPVYAGPILGPSDTNYFESFVEDVSVPYDKVHANTLVCSLPWIYEDHFDFVNTMLLDQIRRHLEKLTLRLKTTQPKGPIFYLRVSEGCTGHCTYCSERLIWGKIKSRPIDEVISTVRFGLQEGYNRFFLQAEDLGAYGLDTGCSVIDLLEGIVNLDKKRNYKIIINQLTPAMLKSMFAGFREIFASGKIEELGCQVQSGSNRILKLMGRNHKAEDWRDVMLKINAEFPDIRLGTHFMVGFPTETNKDFEATLKLLDYPLFLRQMGIFKFSPRIGVPASLLKGQIPESIKESRYRRLQRKFLYMYSFNLMMKGLFSIHSKHEKEG